MSNALHYNVITATMSLGIGMFQLHLILWDHCCIYGLLAETLLAAYDCTLELNSITFNV